MKHKFLTVALAGALALCVGLAGCGESETEKFDDLEKAAEEFVGSRVTQEQLLAAEEALTKDDLQCTVKMAYTVKFPALGEDGKVLFFQQTDVYTVHVVDGTKHHLTQTERGSWDFLGKETVEITDDVLRSTPALDRSLPRGTCTEKELTEAQNEILHERRQKNLELIERGSLSKDTITIEEEMFGQEFLAKDVYSETTAEGEFGYWKCYDGSYIKRAGNLIHSNIVGDILSLILGGQTGMKNWVIEPFLTSEEFVGWRAEHPDAPAKEFFASDACGSWYARSWMDMGNMDMVACYDEDSKGYILYQMSRGSAPSASYIVKFDQDGRVAALVRPKSFTQWEQWDKWDTARDAVGYYYSIFEYGETEVVLPTDFVSDEA